jgi:magnesium chelatase family protein
VRQARERQESRLGPGRCNGATEGPELRRTGCFDEGARAAMELGHAQLGLSGRGWDRVLGVARTIADLGGEAHVAELHVSEALNLRRRGGP